MPSQIKSKAIKLANLQIDRQKRRFSTRHLYGKKKVFLSDAQVMVTLLSRNSIYFIRKYIEYYLSIGAHHILIIDNGSTDGSLEAYQYYDRVTVLQNLLPAKHNESGLRTELSQRVAKGGWILFADSDELIELPVKGSYALERTANYCNQHGFTAVLGQMLDRYSDSPYSELKYLNYTDTIDAMSLYSLNNIEKIPYNDRESVVFSWHLRNNICADSRIQFRRGGLRSELFGEDPFLSKHSLVKNLPEIILMPHPHCASNVTIADFTLLIHHYKLAGQWVQRDIRSVNENLWEHKEDVTRLSLTRDGNVAPISTIAPQQWEGLDKIRLQGFHFESDTFQLAMKD